MLKHRVIPTLLLKDGGLVKTRKFENPQYVGDPVNAIRIFNEKEVDELTLLDIGASKQGREPDYDLIEEVAGECFMPLTYGGGIKTIDQAVRIFRSGVEKICLQSLCFENLSTVRDMVDSFGSQSIVVSVDVKRTFWGERRLYCSSTNRIMKGQAIESHLTELMEAGVGEIILGSVDKDGTLSGPDIELITSAARNLDVPLVALGGVSSLSDMKSVVNAGASAVSAGAFFIFHGQRRAVLITYPNYEELEKLFK
jgi:imidazole glycerol-phosphate synthase subunit HisF